MKQQADQMILAIDRALASLGFGTMVADRQGQQEPGSHRTITMSVRPSGTSA
jgi:hypothetical protein